MWENVVGVLDTEVGVRVVWYLGLRVREFESLLVVALCM